MLSLEGKSSPWGKIQYVSPVIPGIHAVSTVGHGGLKLDRKYNALIPESLRAEGGWYEEDCEWSIPYVILSEYIIKESDPLQAQSVSKKIISAHKTWKMYNYRSYEAYFGVILQPGESASKDEAIWKHTNKNEYQVVYVFGDWHVKVPSGMVALQCRIGGHSGSLREKWFLVPASCYTGGHFLPELSYHREISSL